MQVTLVDYEGIPSESIISIRAGGERRQATVKQNHPFQFPSLPQQANPIRIDVMSTLGSRMLSLDPRQSRHTIDVGETMKVVLDIMEMANAKPVQGSPQKVPAIPGFKGKITEASEYNSYLERHNIVNFIQDIFIELLGKMPDDPYGFLAGKLEGVRIEKGVDQQLIEGEMRIDELLDFMKEDKAEIKKQFGRASVCPDLPLELQEFMRSTDFKAQCNAKFDLLDADGNGTLDAVELFPVIVEVSQESPYAVTYEHCERLLKTFDDSNSGNLTREEFFEFVKFLYLMQYLEAMATTQPAGDEFDDEMLEAEIRVDELLDMMEQDRSVVKKQIGRASQCPDMPPDLMVLMASDDFKTKCNEQFDALDEDKNGVLTVEELYPILDDISQEHPMAITLDHCKRFLKIFDDTNSGNLTRPEFFEFVKFMYLMQWLESVEPQKKSQAKAAAPQYDAEYNAEDVDDLIETLEGEFRIDDMLDRMKKDKHAVKREFGRASQCSEIPVQLAELMASEAFKAQCDAQFDELDKDKNGTLSADELFPVIVFLSQEREQSVTMDHCQRFLETFDEGKSGNLTRTEFFDFVKFIYFMLWLESGAQAPVVDEAIGDSAAIAEGELRINDLLTMVKQDRAAIKKEFGRASLCPDIPADLYVLMGDPDFKKACEDEFDVLDVDKSGTLEAAELFPIIVKISQEHPMSVTFEHCQRFLETFDDSKSGNLTRSEFFEFVKFSYLMRWIGFAASTAWLEPSGFKNMRKSTRLRLIGYSQSQLDAAMTQMGDAVDALEGEMRIDELLQIMQEDKAEVKRQFGRASLCPDMPPELMELMASEEFKLECEAKFDYLDVDGSGTLTADELFPVILEVSNERPVSVTMDHCKKFLATFDESNSGNLTRKEFFDFVKFLYLMQWLDAKSDIEEQIEGELRVDDLLEMMQEDKREVKRQFGRASQCQDMPPELMELMASEEFKIQCEDKFDSLDVDRNGTLSADELYPVILEISEVHPMSVTLEHCKKFLAIFDESKSGNLTRKEFFDFMKFLYLMLWLEARSQAFGEIEEQIEGELRVDDLLEMMQRDRKEVKKQFGRASQCPDIPMELQEMMGSESFKKKAEERFDNLDGDGNGVLSAEELYPVLVEISQENSTSITYEHCVRFMEMFDDSKSGNLTRKEFFEFAKFMYLMMWMEDQAAAAAEQNAILEDELKVDELLDMMQHNKQVVRQQFGRASACPDLPPDLLMCMGSDEFKLRCEAQFEALDEDKNGTLSADELFPIIISMTSDDPVHPYAVTYDHCQRLLNIFDDTNSGNLTKTEFYDFVKFMYLMSHLEEQERVRQIASEGSLRIDMMLNMLDEGVSQIRKNIRKVLSSPDLPQWLGDLLSNDEFMQTCNKQFETLDVNKDGTLSPDELFPVIVELSEEHPLSVTMEHCQYLTVIFDEDCNGVISRDEFAQLVRFIFLVQWLKDQPRAPAPPGTPTGPPPPMAVQGRGISAPMSSSPSSMPVELEATSKQLQETQKTLKAVQEQLQQTTATMTAMMSSGVDPGSPVSWEKERKKLIDDLSASQQLQELQKKGMAETVGKLMVEKQDAEMKIMMAKNGYPNPDTMLTALTK